MNALSASPHLLALVEWYRQLSPDTLPEIRHYYREDARFRDPFNRLDRRNAARRTPAVSSASGPRVRKSPD